MPKLPNIAALFKRKGGDQFDEDDDYEDDAEIGGGADGAQVAAPDAAPGAEGDGLDTLLKENAERTPRGDEEKTPPSPGEDSAEASGEAGAGAVPETVPGPDDDLDEDEDDYDFGDDEFDEEPSKKPLLIAAGGALVVVIGILGGAGWWYFSGDDDGAGKMASKTGAKTASRSREKPKGPSFQLTLAPPKGEKGAPQPMLSPPPGSPASITPKTAIAPALGRGKSGVETARRAGQIGGRFGGKANPLGGSLNAVGGRQEKGIGLVMPSVTSVTLRSLPDHPGGIPLGPTPDARLIEKKEGLPGPLPRIGEDGTTPWQAYARPYKEEKPGARVAVVLTGMGLSRAATMAAIGKLPPQVTLALSPYATDLSDWLVRARLVGHEVMLAIPMESERFPVQDAGPFSLDTSLKVEDNLKRLDLVLSQLSGYFGVTTTMGSRFGTSEKLLTPVIEVLNKKGLFILIPGTEKGLLLKKLASKIGMPRAVVDINIDEVPSLIAIEAQLLRLESILKEKKSAIAVAQPYPSTIARLIVWFKKLQGKKINLVPLSALADTTKTREE